MADRIAKQRALWAASDWDDVAAYIGPNADAFRATWAKLRERAAINKSTMVFGWSWPAFFLTFVWWAYRKQWWMVAVLISLPLLLGLLLPGHSASTAGASIVIAMIAKSTYVQIAVAKIAKVKAAGGGIADIDDAGGVSVPAAIVAGLVYVAAASALVFAYIAAQA